MGARDDIKVLKKTEEEGERETAHGIISAHVVGCSDSGR